MVERLPTRNKLPNVDHVIKSTRRFFVWVKGHAINMRTQGEGLGTRLHIRAEGKHRIWPHDQSPGGSRSGYFGSSRYEVEAGVAVENRRRSLKATADTRHLAKCVRRGFTLVKLVPRLPPALAPSQEPSP